jgi:hypothetical protein
MGGQTKANEMNGCETTMVFNTMDESHGGGKKEMYHGVVGRCPSYWCKDNCYHNFVANAFNIDHPNYVLKNVCVLVDKNKKPSIQM